VAEWVLDEDRRTLGVGETLAEWLTFTEVERLPQVAPDRVQTIRGLARPLPRWPGTEDGHHPVSISVDGATLYWDAPRPVDGPVELAGVVSLNNIDAPDGFPVTRGVIRRVRMEWQATGTGTDGQRVSLPGAAIHYEDVPVSYLPGYDDGPGPGFRLTPAAIAAQALRWSGCLVDLDPDTPEASTGETP
jgi:hypothetical protein